MRSRVQDPGATTLVLIVRNVDEAFAPLKQAAVPVVTLGGAPIAVDGGKARAVVVKDPDGHFVELRQPTVVVTGRVSAQVTAATRRLGDGHAVALGGANVRTLAHMRNWPTRYRSRLRTHRGAATAGRRGRRTPRRCRAVPCAG